MISLLTVTNSRTQTQRFDVTVADGNPFDGPPDFPVPGGNYIATADGYWALLKPLSVGNHDLHIKGVIEFLP